MPEQATHIPAALAALGLGAMGDEARAADGLARVIAVHKDHYLVSRGDGDVFAEAAGKFLHRAQSAMDLPTVGDWVRADFLDDGTHAVIRELLPRKSLLRRKSAGRNVDYQLIGANIDTAFVLQSLDHDFNPRRLERYLVMINQGNIRPVLLLSKSDLVSPAAVESSLEFARKMQPGLEALGFSNLQPGSLQRVRELMDPGRTYCLLGSSGVGKTTLAQVIAQVTSAAFLPTRGSGIRPWASRISWTWAGTSHVSQPPSSRAASRSSASPRSESRSNPRVVMAW